MFLKGDRCYSDKCAVDRRAYGPGDHGQGRHKVSEYGMQLREKQKAKRIYGVMEKQFRRYFAEAERQKGVTGENLVRLLERRLDNVIYRLGFAESRPQARQLVMHGHFTINGNKLDIPSYLVKPGEVIAVKNKSQSIPLFQAIKESGKASVPSWLECNLEALQAKVVSLPEGEDLDIPIEAHLIVELYSR